MGIHPEADLAVPPGGHTGIRDTGSVTPRRLVVFAVGQFRAAEVREPNMRWFSGGTRAGTERGQVFTVNPFHIQGHAPRS